MNNGTTRLFLDMAENKANEDKLRELRAKRRKLVSYRDICIKDVYKKHEALEVEFDIMDINAEIKERGGIL